jgi:hypothetical protein
MAALTYEQAYNKMVNGVTPVDVFEDWRKATQEPTTEDLSNTKSTIALAWEEARSRSIKARIRRPA